MTVKSLLPSRHQLVMWEFANLLPQQGGHISGHDQPDHGCAGTIGGKLVLRYTPFTWTGMAAI